MTLEDLKKKNLPDTPGVYLFKTDQKIIYVGKATSLKDRTRSYFANDLIKTRGPSIVDMVTKSNNISYKKTGSVLEALILESALIKEHQPRYNIKEKDNKSYNHVIITDEKFPRVILVRGHEIKEGKLTVPVKREFGPFPGNSQLKEALKVIQKILPFFDNSKPINTLNNHDKKRILLNIQIGLYPDIFSGKVSLAEYKKTIKNIILFFEGKKREIIRHLVKQMKEYSAKQEFEKAAGIKRTIFALEHINDVSLLSEDKTNQENPFRMEAYDIAHMAGSNTVGVMTVFENGSISKAGYRKFIIKEAKRNDDYGALAEVLTRRFQHNEWARPDIIIIDGGMGQRNVAVKILQELNINEIEILSVVKDDKHRAKGILGSKKISEKYSKDITLLNAESHRFAISFHRKRRSL